MVSPVLTKAKAECEVQPWGREGTRCPGSARAALEVAVAEKLVSFSPGSAQDGHTSTAHVTGWMLEGRQWDTG